MSDVSENPSFHLSKHPQKLVTTNKQVMLKTKPTKRSGKSRNKNNMIMMRNTTIATTSSSNNSNNNNNKPLKVVHISNPMKFQATAVEFRALVQGLTGRDAVVEWPEEPNYDTHHHHHSEVASGGGTGGNGGGGGDDEVVVQLPQNDQEVTLSTCFGPSNLSYDYFGSSFHGHVSNDDDHMIIMEEFRAFVGDYNDH